MIQRHLRGVMLSIAAVVATACGPAVHAGGAGGEPGRVGGGAARGDASKGPARGAGKGCPAAVDGKEILARHGQAYGSPEAVAATLPVVLSGSVTVEGKTGKVEAVLTKDHFRTQAYVAGMYGASGVDARGAWNMDGGAGVVERLSATEGLDAYFDPWLLRRGYVSAFDPARDKARCTDDGGAARVEIAFDRPELGDPKLTFDLETGALLAATHRQSDGKALLTTFEAWGDRDPASKSMVRWPKKQTDHPVAGSNSTSELTERATGLSCVRIDLTGVAIPERGEACLAPPANRFTLTWPGEGIAGVVRVPMTYHGSEVFVRAKVGGREVWALLDSGASITALDATAPIASSFTPAVEMTGSGATQKVRFGIGEIATITVGGLEASHVPVASVPIPALDAFGDKRPELILGYSFFASAAIRVDYAHGMVAFHRVSDGLFAKNVESRALPLRVLKSKMVADGEVEGARALFEIDTGNAGGLDLYKKWASAHDMPGSRPSLALKGKFGVGAGETTSVFFRHAKGALGPIRFDDRVAHISDPPDPGDIAGLAGNEVLSRCDAIVFDLAKRTLFLEGSCDRKNPERKMGWRFEKRPDPAFPDRPWVVSAMWPGSPADRAGVRPGDRLLEVGGKPASQAIEAVWTAESGPDGTKVPVVVFRNGKQERLVAELRSLLR
ncbi:MAG: aspartyl protease family protein [Deltaproteobacteria bacterium]|nr:aspartyl protease family protein [Deltaproteobacteria bacterium]